MHRGDLTDAQWERLQPLLPPQRHGTGTTGGRPSDDHRPIINGILWILRTGAPWDDLPGALRDAFDGFEPLLPLEQQGMWDGIYDAVKAQADAVGALEWDLHHVEPPWCVPTSTRRGQKRGASGGSAGAQPRRLQHQGPPPRRWQRQADDHRADARRAP